MKFTRLIRSAYRKGFPNLSGIVMNHEMFNGLIKEAHGKMYDSRDSDNPFRIPVYKSPTAVKNARWVENNGGWYVISDMPDYQDIEEPVPMAWVTGIRIRGIGEDYELDLYVEFEIDDNELLIAKEAGQVHHMEAFVNKSRHLYYTVIGKFEEKGRITFGEPTSIHSFHFDEFSDHVVRTGTLPKED